MTKIVDQDQQDNIMKIMPGIAKFIEDKAEEFYQTDQDRVNFVLSTAVNLLGNLCMRWANETIESKLNMSTNTVENLMEWYKTALAHYKTLKEAH